MASILYHGQTLPHRPDRSWRDLRGIETKSAPWPVADRRTARRVAGRRGLPFRCASARKSGHRVEHRLRREARDHSPQGKVGQGAAPGPE